MKIWTCDRCALQIESLVLFLFFCFQQRRMEEESRFRSNRKIKGRQQLARESWTGAMQAMDLLFFRYNRRVISDYFHKKWKGFLQRNFFILKNYNYY